MQDGHCRGGGTGVQFLGGEVAEVAQQVEGIVLVLGELLSQVDAVQVHGRDVD